MISLQHFISNSRGGSLLGDFDDMLDIGDDLSSEALANEKDSNLRKIFKISNHEEKPFSVEKINGKNALSLNSTSGTSLILNTISCTTLDLKNEKINISDELDRKIDVLSTSEPIYIYDNDDKISSCICKEIIGGCINISSNKISNVVLNTKHVSHSRYFPNIVINSRKDSLLLSNSKLEIDYSKSSMGKFIIVGDIPVFNNVESKTINKILILDKESVRYSHKETAIADILGNRKWNNIFDFNYKLEAFLEGKYYKTIKINNIKDLCRIVSSRNFNKITFNEFPLKLKKNAKLTDFIDISGFESLSALTINADKVSIMFVKEDHSKKYINAFYNIMLGKTKYSNAIEAKSELLTTSDGWNIIITKL